MVTTQTQIRRDTATNLNAATPVSGELGYDTTNKRLVVGDGSTAGGIKHASAKDIQNQSFTAATVGGTANAITLTCSPTVTSYATNLKVIFKPTSDSSSAVTLNVDGLGAKDAKYALDNVLTAFDATTILKSGLYYEAVYDGTQFQILGIGKSSATAVTSITTSDGITGGPITSTGTISLDTNNSAGVGAICMIQQSTGGSLANGATVSGSSNMKFITISGSGTFGISGTSPSGTWRNIMGVAVANNGIGLFIRTA